MKYTHSYISCLFAILMISVLSIGCAKEKDDQARLEEMIEEEVNSRLANYRQIVLAQCRKRMLEEASEIVDSILIEQARLGRDSLLKPPKPSKPEKPEIKSLKDTVPVKPLLPTTKDSIDS